MWGLSLDSSPLSPPSTIQSHPACGHRNSDKRRLANGRGESYNKITSLLSARRSASQNRLQTGCSVSGPGLPGLAGGPMGRQSQLPRKVPLNFPCCLHTLPGLCGLGQSHIGLCWSRPPPSSVLGRVGGGRGTRPGAQAPALFGPRAACSGPGPVDFPLSLCRPCRSLSWEGHRGAAPSPGPLLRLSSPHVRPLSHLSEFSGWYPPAFWSWSDMALRLGSAPSAVGPGTLI